MRTPQRNPKKDPKAAFKERDKSLLYKYSPIKAHKKGRTITPTGPKKIHRIVQTIQPVFHHLDHQNFFVQTRGKA